MTRTKLCLLSAAAVMAMPAMASDLQMPPQLLEKVEAATEACASFENGEFALEWSAVTRVDLDGDLAPDWALNEAGFACSSAASLYCGTGGCMTHFLVGDTVASLQNRGWEMTTFGPHRVLLADVHGSQCDGINPTPCVVAAVWNADEGVWTSTAAIWEE